MQLQIVTNKFLTVLFQDEQYYHASITGLSPTTAVVLFEAYGNHEEVLLSDLRPVSQHQGHKGGHRDNIAPTPGLPPAFRQQ